MILKEIADVKLEKCITRTCGGDPGRIDAKIKSIEVLPAHAGVILAYGYVCSFETCITRTCGGDPANRAVS